MTKKRDRLAAAFATRLHRLLDELRRLLADELAARPIVAQPGPRFSAPPWSVGTALDQVQRDAAVLAGLMGDQLRIGSRLLIGELPDSALETCVEPWPWPTWEATTTPAGFALGFLLDRLKETGRVPPRGEAPPWAWTAPADELAEVAQWAQQAVVRLAERTYPEWAKLPPEERKQYGGSALLGYATGDPLIGPVRANGTAALVLPGEVFPHAAQDPPPPALPAPALALLCRLAKTLEDYAPQPPTLGLLSVERAPVRTLTSLVGADPRLKDPDASLARLDTGGLVALEFKWADGQTLNPHLDFTPGAGALTAIAARYGDAAVRDLLGLFFATWVARARADQAVWIWPSEQLEIVGLVPSRDNRQRLARLIRDLGQTTLTARYTTGRALHGPVLTTSASDGDAIQVKLHPALVLGVTDEEGRPGHYWWPIPLALLRLPANRSVGPVHVLAPILGSLWRAELPHANGRPVARIGPDRLADRLGIRGKSSEERERNPEAADTLRRALTAAQDAGLIGDWSHANGSLDRLDGVLTISPGQQALAIIGGGPAQKPAWLPATGADLARWLRLNGWTSAEAGQRLGIPDRTIRWTAAIGPRPLPIAVRDALRRLLWPEPNKAVQESTPKIPSRQWEGGGPSVRGNERGGVLPRLNLENKR